MGNVWCPDIPLTMREALAAQEKLEQDWRVFEKQKGPGRRSLAHTAVAGILITAGLGGGMQGEELNRLDMGVIWKH